MSRFEGPAVCFFHNPLRLDHMISIRLGSLDRDYTNGSLWNATVTLSAVVEALNFASVVSYENHKEEMKNTFENTFKCDSLSPGSLDFRPLEFFFNMFLPVVNRLVSSSNGLVGVRDRAVDTFCMEPWRRPTLSWGGEPFP